MRLVSRHCANPSCDVTFPPKSAKHRYHERTCKQEHRKMLRREENKIVTRTVVCGNPKCGAVFVTNKRVQLYCSKPCRVAGQSVRWRALRIEKVKKAMALYHMMRDKFPVQFAKLMAMVEKNGRSNNRHREMY